MSSLEQRLARFVDRESELRAFCRMLDDADFPRPIMLVWGDGGIGKTSLIARMIHECSLRSLVKAEVIWTDTRNHDYLGVMRKIRDDVGAGKFSEFTKRVNYFTDPTIKLAVEGISVGQGASISGQVGTMAGIVVKDSMFFAPRPDIPISDTDRMAQLTDLFIQELTAAAQEKKIVIFLDALEKAAEDTQRWVWGELLGPVRDDRLANVRFVMGRRNQPTIDDRWRPLIEETQLGPLKREHIIEYLIKRIPELKESDRASTAKAILACTGGNPLRIANAAELLWQDYEEDRRQKQLPEEDRQQ